MQEQKNGCKQKPVCTRGVKSVEIARLIKTMLVIGEGTESDPKRYLTQYWDLSGNLLWSDDPFIQESEPGT